MKMYGPVAASHDGQRGIIFGKDSPGDPLRTQQHSRREAAPHDHPEKAVPHDDPDKAVPQDHPR